MLHMKLQTHKYVIDNSALLTGWNEGFFVSEMYAYCDD